MPRFFPIDRHTVGGVALAALLLGSSTGLHARNMPPVSRHPHHAPCASCHVGGNEVERETATMLIASQEQLCGKCHQDVLRHSHPSGFTPPPGHKIPPDYPLDRKGNLTCSTCHEVHGNGPGRLRGDERAHDFCTTCHNQAFFDSMPDGGASIMQSGHLGAGKMSWQHIDQHSLRCLECHGEKGEMGGEGSQILHHGLAVEHSVGRNYAAAERYGGYKPAVALQKKIHLPNGMVSCVSCHECYSKKHGKTVTPKAGSALCFECHSK